MDNATPYRFRFTLSRLLGWFVVYACLVAVLMLFVTVARGARSPHYMVRCKHNLKQLGVYLHTYCARYGSDVDYPGTVPPPGALAGAVGAGPNGAFWSHLWTLPDPKAAVWKRPGEDALAKCRIYGGATTSTALDWAGPNLADPAFPGMQLSDRVRATTHIGGDSCLPGDANHGNDAAGAVDYDFHVLLFDGAVRTLSPSSREQAVYYAQTSAYSGGVRSR